MSDEAGWVSLRNVKLVGANPNADDHLYLLSPDDATPGDTLYYYWDFNSIKDAYEGMGDPQPDEFYESLVGWWTEFDGDPESPGRADDLEFKTATFFIGEIPEMQEVTIACNGEAQREPTPANFSGQNFPTFANPVPRTITLGEVTTTGMDPNEDDHIYQLLPDDATPGDTYYYYWDFDSIKAAYEGMGDPQPDEFYESLVGWWTEFDGDPESPGRADDAEFPAGAAFIGDFQNTSSSGNTVVIAFPAAVL